MSNNYTGACFAFDCGTSENAQTVKGWVDLLRSYDAEFDDETPEGWDALPEELKKLAKENSYSIQANTEIESVAPATVWFYHDETIDLDAVAVVMQVAMSQLAGVPEGQGFTWATWCDRARPDEFGGGAIFVTRTEIMGEVTNYLLDEFKAKFREASK